MNNLKEEFKNRIIDKHLTNREGLDLLDNLRDEIIDIIAKNSYEKGLDEGKKNISSPKKKKYDFWGNLISNK